MGRTPPTTRSRSARSLAVKTSAAPALLNSASTSADWSKPLPGITRAVLVLHGRLRNADTYFKSALTAQAAAGAVRSRAHVGGQAVPVSVLADLGEDLIAMHGQSAQQRLLAHGPEIFALARA